MKPPCDAHVKAGDKVSVLICNPASQQNELKHGYTVTAVVSATDCDYRVNVAGPDREYLECHPDCIELADAPWPEAEV